jgi:hypothetical protein
MEESKNSKKNRFGNLIRNELDKKQSSEISEHMNNQNPQNHDELKKGLSGQYSPKESAVEQDDLEKIDPRGLTEADFRYRPGFPWVKTILFFVIFSALGYGLFFAAMNFTKGAKVYLSVREIDPNSPPALTGNAPTFPVGERLMLYFDNGRAIGSDSVTIRILETYSNADDSLAQTLIAEHNLKIRPSYKTVYTAFQRDYFDQKGDYVLEILSGTGPLAQSEFKIK